MENKQFEVTLNTINTPDITEQDLKEIMFSGSYDIFQRVELNKVVGEYDYKKIDEKGIKIPTSEMMDINLKNACFVIKELWLVLSNGTTLIKGRIVPVGPYKKQVLNEEKTELRPGLCFSPRLMSTAFITERNLSSYLDSLITFDVVSNV